MSKLVSTNPADNYEKIGEVEISTEKEIKEKVAMAREAQKSWADFGLTKRIDLLRKLAKYFEDNKKPLAALISQEMGMLKNEADDDMTYGLEYLIWYLDNAEKYLSPEITYEDKNEIHQAHHEPVGVVAAIIPWNFPFSNFIWQCGQNLIAGNVVVFKHSEETPLFGKEIEKAFEKINIPKGVFNEVYGDGKVGDILASQNIDMICFTGSSDVGKKIYKLAAKKFIPVLMELGGSAPGIVFEDADIDNIVESIYMGRFLNAGQACDGLKRLIVHESKFDEVVEKLKKVITEKEIAPLVAKRQLELLGAQINDALDKGAEVVVGGKSGEKQGAYFQATLLGNIKPEMRVWQEEVFGPVLPIVVFKTYEEAIELANDTSYGLGGFVFTQDKKLFVKAAHDIKTGMVEQNNLTYLMPCNAFGGCKDSGFGRQHGRFGFEEVIRVKIITSEK